MLDVLRAAQESCLVTPLHFLGAFLSGAACALLGVYFVMAKNSVGPWR